MYILNVYCLYCECGRKCFIYKLLVDMPDSILKQLNTEINNIFFSREVAEKNVLDYIFVQGARKTKLRHPPPSKKKIQP